MSRERNIQQFNKDVTIHDGYRYTAGDRLSCRLSNKRMSQAVLSLADVRERRVIDIGCGDGTFTRELAAAGAKEVVGVDAADAAVECARSRSRGADNVSYRVADIYSLDRPPEAFDVAVVRGILHHLYRVEDAVDRICRVAREIVVVEPNGYNPVLKVLEKVSPYHVAHEEKSYSPRRLDRWFEERGGRVEKRLYIGLVPMFCPDFMARALKVVEPLVEGMPLVRNLSCGQYVQKIVMG